MTSASPSSTRVIALAGRTRAGKTTLAERLAGDLGCRQASFSSFVRAEAVARGLDQERLTLQDLGAEMIATLGPVTFARGALEHAGLSSRNAPFVIEGVRHLTVLEGLRQVAKPVPVALVYLAVSDQARNSRLAAEGISAEEGRRWEAHSTERDVLHGLEAVADIVVDADRDRDFAANTVEDWLART